MSKVYVIREPMIRNAMTGEWERKIDLAPAQEYGEIVFLLPPGRSAMQPQPTVAIMRAKLKDFSDDDYLLPIGDPALIVIAGAIAADQNRGRVKVLCWDRKYTRYLVSDAWTRGQPELENVDG